MSWSQLDEIFMSWNRKVRLDTASAVVQLVRADNVSDRFRQLSADLCLLSSESRYSSCTPGFRRRVYIMPNSVLIIVNGSEVLAHCVELLGGLRIQFALDDWQRLDLYRGQCVRIRLPEKEEMRLYLAEAVETPPVAWVILFERFRNYGAA